MAPYTGICPVLGDTKIVIPAQAGTQLAAAYG
jgi:hypothetical protein